MTTENLQRNDADLTLYGGQALLDGVLFRGRRACALAVRNDRGEVMTATRVFSNRSSRLGNAPILRGLALFLEGITLSIWAMQQSMGLVRSNAVMDGQPGRGRLLLIFMLALALGGVLFVVLPKVLADVLLGDAARVVRSSGEGLLRVVILVGYGAAIGRLRPIQVGFAYHGAEHMVGRAAERGLPIAVEAIRTMSRTLPWCGTTMILMAVVVAGAVFPIIDLLPRGWSFLVRVGSVPVIFALSVEILLWAGPHQGHFLIRPLFLVSHWLQHLTTRQPSDEQIEVAMRAFLATKQADG